MPASPGMGLPLLPGNATLGVLGGGQLGRMFVHAAQTLGYRVAVLEPDAASPAGAARGLAPVRGLHDDAAALDRLQQACAAVTTEFENVPAASLRRLAASRRGVRRLPPRWRSASTGRARSAASSRRACHVRRTVRIESAADAASAAAAALLPGILKTSRLGYDGKGQAAVASAGALPARLVRARRSALRAGAAPAAAPRDQRHRRAGRRRPGGAPAGAAKPASRRHPRGDAGACAGHRRRHRGPGDRAARRGWPMRSTMSACCASSSSCCRTVRWSPTRWRRGRTTPATTASTPATSRSSSCSCARWPVCRWWRRGSTRRR